jgi:hypothetical protein
MRGFIKKNITSRIMVFFDWGTEQGNITPLISIPKEYSPSDWIVIC